MAFVEQYNRTQIQLSFEEEATPGASPANIDRFLRVAQDNPTLPWPERGDIETLHTVTGQRSPHLINDKNKQTLDGSFTLQVHTGEFLGAIFGKVATLGSDPYTHTITVLETGLPTFALQAAFVQSGNNLVQEWNHCRVNDATFQVSESNEKLEVDVNFMCADVGDGGDTPETVTPDTTPPFVFKEAVFSSTSLYEGPKAQVFDFKTSISHNLNPNWAMGQGYTPHDVVYGKTTFENLEVLVGLVDDTEWEEVIGAPGTAHDFSVVFTRGADDTLTLSGTGKLKAVPPDLSNNDIRANLTLVLSTMQCVIVNSTATFPFTP